MQIEERAVGDVTVVTVTGDITLNKGGDVILKDKINSLLQQGNKKILLDLGRVAYVDSAGLGQLVQVKVTASRSAAELKLLNITKRLKDLLVVTRLSTVFDSFESEAEGCPAQVPATALPAGRGASRPAPARRSSLVQRAGNGQGKGGDRRIEAFAVCRHHVVAALHGAYRRLQGTELLY